MADVSRLSSDLFEWLRSHGAQIGNVAVGSNISNERGLFATAAIAKGDLLLAVPQALMFVTAVSEGSSNDSVEDALCVALLLERSLGEASRWTPWLRGLPTPDEQPSPLLWPEQELELFQCPLLQAQLRREMAALPGRLLRLKPRLEAEVSTDVSVADLAWALATVRSRAAYCPSDAGAMALVPLGDMFNHEATERACEAGFDVGSGTYRYYSSVAIAAGEEVLAATD